MHRISNIKILLKKYLPLVISIPIASILIILLTTSFTYIYLREKQTSDTNTQIVEVNDDEDLESEEVIPIEGEDTPEEVVNEDETESEPEEESKTSTTPKTTTTKEEVDSEKEEEPDPEPEKEEEEEEEPKPESPSAYVAFYADNQSDTDQEDANHLTTVNHILGKGANPVFHAGDLMEDGTQDSLDRFNTVTSTLKATRSFYAALGNNDRKVGDSTTPSPLYLANFNFPNNELWYSVNTGNLHMIILDSAFNASNTTQRSWLLSDLQSSASQSRITGVMFHHPTFLGSIYTDLVNNGADFVISGHYHAYSHNTTYGIDQFILYGQPSMGYMTAVVYEDYVILRAYNSSNTFVASYEIENK